MTAYVNPYTAERWLGVSMPPLLAQNGDVSLRARLVQNDDVNKLVPGERVVFTVAYAVRGWNGVGEWVGVVDPFRHDDVRPGRWFYVLLRPDSERVPLRPVTP